jgi:TM2 domain-containing membrane protein YozV
MVKTKTAYLLWLLGLCGFGGVHRMYLGKPVSGVFYFLTGGFFFIGQLVDLLLIPSMVEEKNLKYKLLQATSDPVQSVEVHPHANSSSAGIHRPPRLDVQILKLCRDTGAATLSDCVIETGADPAQIKTTVHQLCLDGLLMVDNRERDGAVVYKAI